MGQGKPFQLTKRRRKPFLLPPRGEGEASQPEDEQHGLVTHLAKLRG
jgi:hypothetical protein